MDSLGFLAYGFVLLSATTNDIRWLRAALFGSNLLFVIYGFLLGLMPILLFNLLLGCINGYQVFRAWRRSSQQANGGANCPAPVSIIQPSVARRFPPTSYSPPEWLRH